MSIRERALTVIDLIAALAGSPSPSISVPAVRVNSAVIDSRLATPGCLFVALRGSQLDGHDFIGEALANGAVAVIAERLPALPSHKVWVTEDLEVHRIDEAFCLITSDSLAALQQAAAHWRRKLDVRAIGVTGSVGKTMSKEVIAGVLRRRYRTLKSEGNYNNEIGLPLTLLHLTSAHERVVLEMGMYDLGEIAALAEIALPQVGVVTNVGPTHLERLGTMERVAQAKAELPMALPQAEEKGVAVLNADDPRVRAMADQTSAHVFLYGLRADADLWANDIESQGLEGIRFRFHYGRETAHAQVPLLGRHSVHTALSAAAVGLVEGLSWEEILSGLQDQSGQLRLAAVEGPKGSIILDDTYNASPASCLAALNLLAELDGRRIAILGDMYELGRYEEEGHRLVGRRARNVVDLLIAVGSLGRIIGEEALHAGMNPETVHLAASKDRATELVQALLQGGDVLLVKGSRGMELETIVSALTTPVARDDPGTGGKAP
jgi:UDP-N-acetylmuramoyl-tripeptide--D-alanyl-D-alanine ligase